MKISNDRIILNKDTPAAFMAVSSKFSPKLPNVISEANSMANGKAMGTREKTAYMKNSLNTDKLIPLPTRSVICFHKNCIKSMKMQMRNVIKNNVKKRLNIYESIFFILNMLVFFWKQQNYGKKFNNQMFDLRKWICLNLKLLLKEKTI
jgi:hypothetical protein